MEEGIEPYPIAQSVLEKLQGTAVPIRHYKDVFNRPGQDFLIQKQSQKLILARRRDNFLYKGAAVCDRYGHSNFYYATLMMNCPYNCAYCYLQAKNPSANIVAFVNPEDYFPAVEAALPAYVSISYDSDILAFEDLFGYGKIWVEFARAHPALTLEIRTKSTNIPDTAPVDNVILAWTVSPESVIEAYEEGTPPLEARLRSIKEAIDKGWKVRLCMDPVLPLSIGSGGWKEDMDRLFKAVDFDGVYDISVGAFRMSEAHYKKLKKMRPDFPHLTLNDEEVLKWRCKLMQN